MTSKPRTSPKGLVQEREIENENHWGTILKSDHTEVVEYPDQKEMSNQNQGNQMEREYLGILVHYHRSL